MNILSDDDYFILKSRSRGRRFVSECYDKRVRAIMLSNAISPEDYIKATNQAAEWHKHALKVNKARRIRQNIRKTNDASV